MSDLKPCPFCASPAELFQRWRPLDGQSPNAYTMARCTNEHGDCGIVLDVALRTPEAVTEAWNNRPDAARIRVLEEALRHVNNPLGYLQEQAEREGSRLSGAAYAIANDLGLVQQIAREALGDAS